MFRIPNAIQITAVNNPSTTEDPTPALALPTPDEVAEYATVAAYWTKRAGRGAAVLYVGKKVVDLTADLAHLYVAQCITK